MMLLTEPPVAAPHLAGVDGVDAAATFDPPPRPHWQHGLRGDRALVQLALQVEVLAALHRHLLEVHLQPWQH